MTTSRSDGIRPAEEDDLPALHALFLEAIAGVYRPHAFEPPAPPFEVFAAQQGHLLRTGTARVAVRNGRLAGFAVAFRRGDDWFLSSLFVSGDRQSAGIGSSLLEAVWGADAPRRRTITDAIQPVSNALYARRGLTPLTPMLCFSGRAVQAPAPLESSEDDVDLAELDRAAYGFDRRVDHELWQCAGRRTLWVAAGEVAAYSYRFPGGTIGPVAGRDPEAAADALRSELAAADGSVRVRIPGTSRSLVAAALAAGLRLEPVPGLLLCSDRAMPPDRLAIGSYSLF